MEIFGRNPQNYEGVCNEISVYEQKPIKWTILMKTRKKN